jgi:hypothetical protein
MLTYWEKWEIYHLCNISEFGHGKTCHIAKSLNKKSKVIYFIINKNPFD